MNDYENFRRVSYGGENAVFVPVCERCGRFVKADPTISFCGLDDNTNEPNATCKKCGRTKMIFEGYV